MIMTDLPPMARNAKEAKNILKTGEMSSDFMTANFWALFAAQMVLKSSLKQIWTVFNTLQIVVALPLMKVKMPANVLGVINQFNSIVNMKLVSPEKVYNWVFAPIMGKTAEAVTEENFVKASETESKDEDSNFSLNELKNSSLLVQLSVILVTVALVSSVIGLVVFVRFYLYKKMPQFIKNIILSLQDSLMFNAVLRTLM